MPLDETGGRPGRRPSRNVFGGPLDVCSVKPMTGFFRNGCCDTSPEDVGSHTVCAVMTKEFLAFSKQSGNDLSTPMPEYRLRWLEAWRSLVPVCAALAGSLGSERGPVGVVLRATAEGALQHCALADLVRFAVDLM